MQSCSLLSQSSQVSPLVNRRVVSTSSSVKLVWLTHTYASTGVQLLTLSQDLSYHLVSSPRRFHLLKQHSNLSWSYDRIGGIRSTQSTSALSSIPHRASAHRALKGHRTHGSQTALNFLSLNCSPSSPHRIPRALHHPQDVAQSAPVMGEGLLASDGGSSSHLQSHGWSHDPVGSSVNISLGPKDCRRLLDSAEGLASLR